MFSVGVQLGSVLMLHLLPRPIISGLTVDVSELTHFISTCTCICCTCMLSRVAVWLCGFRVFVSVNEWEWKRVMRVFASLITPSRKFSSEFPFIEAEHKRLAVRFL